MVKLINGAAGQTLVWKFHHIQFRYEDDRRAAEKDSEVNVVS
jgi:hypothetical protein